MQPYTFPNNPTPSRAGDYTDGEGHYMRISVTAGVPMASQPGASQVIVRAWQMDANGNPVADAHGNYVHTEPTSHTVNLSGIAAKQATVNPGWIVYVPPEGQQTPDPANPPAGWASGTALPTTGSLGDHFYNSADRTFWQWSRGILYALHESHFTKICSLIKSNGVLF